MQKKLIALAIAGLSSAAFAQSNVTVYGVGDIGQALVKTSTDTAGAAGQKSVGRLDNNSSHIGFKGSEALGNGLTAVFQFETGIAADAASAAAAVGAGTAFGGIRDTFVGLTGGFGTVLGGTLTHPLRAMGAKVDLIPGAAGIGTMASVTGVLGGFGQTGADNRAPNALAYVSPSFGGFTVTAAYVNGETESNAAGIAEAKQYQLAGAYENGPLYVGAGYHKNDNIGGVAATDARVYRLAAVYTLPSATKLTALYDNTKVDGIAGVAGTFLKRNAWSVGAAQSFGMNTIGLEYARSGDVKNAAGSTDDGSKIISAIYTYSLSKRTLVHARYSKLTNDAAATNNFYNNAVANPTALAAGSDVTGYMVGLRHSF